MKSNNIFFILFIVVLFFIASCTKNQQNTDGDLEFKKMCQDTGYDWMLMKPTKDSKIIQDAKACMGCMIEGFEHICDKEKFKEFLKVYSNESRMDSMNHKMNHQTMMAHGGASDSVDMNMYRVNFIRSEVITNKEALLKFTIQDIETKKPVSELEKVHEKIMHIILVRNDLKYFDHIHPEMTENGVFVVPYNFSSSGIYRIWIDFTTMGMQHIIDFDLNVSSIINLEEEERLGELRVMLNKSDEIKAGKETELRFIVNDKDNNPIPITEKFLGAKAHLIEIDETLEEFGHNHDENFNKDNIIIFNRTFTKTGKHKLWVQFSFNSKERTASFELTVR